MLEKNAKNCKENLYFTKNQFGRNKMWCAVDSHNYMCHIHAKGLLD